MKNHKQLLMDFYLELLKRNGYEQLKLAVLVNLSRELEETPEIVQRIFERMASEDAKLDN